MVIDTSQTALCSIGCVEAAHDTQSPALSPPSGHRYKQGSGLRSTQPCCLVSRGQDDARTRMALSAISCSSRAITTLSSCQHIALSVRRILLPQWFRRQECMVINLPAALVIEPNLPMPTPLSGLDLIQVLLQSQCCMQLLELPIDTETNLTLSPCHPLSVCPPISISSSLPHPNYAPSRWPLLAS
jgi:hypothetical protein